MFESSLTAFLHEYRNLRSVPAGGWRRRLPAPVIIPAETLQLLADSSNCHRCRGLLAFIGPYNRTA